MAITVDLTDDELEALLAHLQSHPHLQNLYGRLRNQASPRTETVPNSSNSAPGLSSSLPELDDEHSHSQEGMASFSDGAVTAIDPVLHNSMEGDCTGRLTTKISELSPTILPGNSQASHEATTAATTATSTPLADLPYGSDDESDSDSDSWSQVDGRRRARQRKKAQGDSRPYPVDTNAARAARSRRPCPRSGVQWVAASWAKAQTLSSGVEKFVGYLSAATTASDRHNPLRWVGSIQAVFDGQRDAYSNDSLVSVVYRVKNTEEAEVSSSFLLMVHYIQFTIKCQSLTGHGPGALSLMALYSREIEPLKKKDTTLPARRTFQDWYAKGTKYAAIASGGTLYSLILVAGMGLRIVVGDLPGDISPYANTLRWPDPNSAAGRLVIQKIIPTIAELRHMFPLSLAALFSEDVLRARQLSHTLDCSDIRGSDRFFDIIRYNNFSLVERQRTSWDSCLTLLRQPCLSVDALARHLQFSSPSTPAPSSSSTLVSHSIRSTPTNLWILTTNLPGLSSSSPMSPLTPLSDLTPILSSPNYDIHVICSGFDPTHPSNKKYTANRGDENIAWTEEERSRALRAENVDTLEGLRSKLYDLYDSSGVRKSLDSYVRINEAILDKSILDIRTASKSPLAWINTTLPAHIRAGLMDSLKCAFGENQSLHNIDTSTINPSLYNFQTLHFSWYNRMATTGTDAPTDVQPILLKRVDCSRTNYTQMIPNISRELSKNEPIYKALVAQFEELFTWISDMLRSHLPDVYEFLQIDCEILPSNQSSPVQPFLGFIINLNITSRCHRDHGDKSYCIVIAIGEFVGGELCLMEAGLVIPLRSGDFVLFLSSAITHFNLHYKGQRASLVLHTDREIDKWLHNRNGWKDNTTFS